MRRIILTSLSVATAAAIFLFSAQSKVDSHALSERVAHVISAQLVKTAASHPENADQVAKQLFEDRIRKIAHVFEYAVFGFLLYFTYASYRKKRPGWRALATGTAFAVTDELHQLLTQTRDALMWDVVIDSLGVALGVALAVSSLWLARLYRQRRLRKPTLSAD